MNQKGQLAILWMLANLVIFVILWALWLGEWVKGTVADYVLINAPTGLELFLISNLALWMWCGVFIGILLTTYLGTGQ